ncbi:Uncharacterized protein APZ42_013836 [Daphnia magna]|uniref:Integrase catalytic domain-containing protein n=1 Tax=Daphnia magna TaxID=35525 RepID=A0A162QGM7_9CRUS|nr:Uncharacterized protein APZ42_013836 [Daphnia magna]
MTGIHRQHFAVLPLQLHTEGHAHFEAAIAMCGARSFHPRFNVPPNLLTLDQALATLRTDKATRLQVSTIWRPPSNRVALPPSTSSRHRPQKCLLADQPCSTVFSSAADQQFVGIRPDVSSIGVGIVGPPLVTLRRIAPPSAKSVRGATSQATCRPCAPNTAVRPRNLSKPETAGSITIQSIVPDDMVQLGVSPACNIPTIFIRVLPDSSASIDAIPAAMFWGPLQTRSVGRWRTKCCHGHRDGDFVAESLPSINDVQRVLSKASQYSQKKFGMLPAQYPHACILAAVAPLLLAAPAPMSDVMPRLRELMTECPLIFYGVCRPMRGPAYHFQLKEGAVPSVIRGSRPIAVPLMLKVKQELDSLEDHHQQSVRANFMGPSNQDRSKGYPGLLSHLGGACGSRLTLISPRRRPRNCNQHRGCPQSFSARVSLVNAMEGSSDTNSDNLLTSVAAATSVDPVMVYLRQTILDGFPNEKCNLPLELRPYWQGRSQLYVDDAEGLLLVDQRVVIPTSGVFFKSTKGATEIRQRPRLSVYWPSMDNDVIVAAKPCPTCTEHLPSDPVEPLLPRAPASSPFEFIFVALDTYRSRQFLIVVDQFSGWAQVYPFLMSTHRRGGNGRSSPHHPQSNGYAESAVKSMKKLIAGSWSSGSFDQDKSGKELLLFRNAPTAGGASLSQIVFRRPTRDLIPAHRRSFAPEWQKAVGLLEKRARRAKDLQIHHFNRSGHPLPPRRSVTLWSSRTTRPNVGTLRESSSRWGPFEITSLKPSRECS